MLKMFNRVTVYLNNCPMWVGSDLDYGMEVYNGLIEDGEENVTVSVVRDQEFPSTKKDVIDFIDVELKRHGECHFTIGAVQGIIRT